jgi:hypothetical protein
MVFDIGALQFEFRALALSSTGTLAEDANARVIRGHPAAE